MRKRSAWKSDSREPNCLRSRMYSMVRSRQNCAPPIEQAAMLSRPPSSPAIAILKPSPFVCRSGSPPAPGNSSKFTMAVGCDFQPSFFSGAPNDRPGVPFSTTMQEMPFGPRSPVRTMQT